MIKNIYILICILFLSNLVLGQISNNTISSSQTICCNTVVSLSGSLPIGCTGTITYLWESSNDNSIFQPIPSSSSRHYVTQPICSNTYFRRIVSESTCTPTSSISDTILISVNHQPIGDNTIGNDQTICSGNTPGILTGSSPSGGNGIYSFLWESSANSSSWFSTTITSTNFTSTSLSSTTYYRRIVTSGVCTPHTSTMLTIRVNPIIGNNTIGSNQTICSGSLPVGLTGSSPSGGNVNYTYLWESSPNNSSWFSTTITSSTISLGALSSTIFYRRVVGAGVCPQNTSSTVTIIVNQSIGNNVIGSSQTMCSGSIPIGLTGTIPTGGNSVYIYLWESSSNNSSWFTTSISGQNISPGSLTSTTYYRRVISAGVCPQNTSSIVTVTVNPTIGNNVIGNSQTICSGSTPIGLTGTIPTGGSSVYTYLWESSSNNSSWFTTGISGLNISPSSLASTTFYRRVVSAGVCVQNTSSIVTITVNQSIGNNFIGSSQTICSGSIPIGLTGTIPTGGNSVYIYLWESSSNNSSWFTTSISGQNISPGSLTSTTYYRRVISAGVCPQITSLIVTVTVNPTIGNNVIGNSQTICSGSTPIGLTGTIPTGGSSVYTYLWESSSNNSSWFTTGISDQNISHSPLTSTTFYRRVVSAGVCAHNTSSIVTITVNQIIGNNVIGNYQTICSGSIPSGFTGTIPTGGNSVYAYLWESSFNNSSWFTTGILGQNISPSSLTSTTYYRRIVSAGVCPQTTSSIVTVTVNPTIGNNVIGSSQTICSGSIPSVLTGATPSGGNSIYTYSWESSSNDSFWALTNISDSSISLGSLISTTYYRRVVNAGICTPQTSTSIAIVVQQISGSTNFISNNQTICSSSAPVTLSGSASSFNTSCSVASYLWEQSVDNSTWSSATGLNSQQTYDPPVLLDTTYYRRQVTSSTGVPCPASSCSYNSNTITIFVNKPIGNNTILSNQTICLGTSSMPLLTGSSPTGGNGLIVYVWQSSSDNSSFSTVGASSDYTPPSLLGNTYFRRIIISGPCLSDTSNIADVTVYQPIGNIITGNQTICTGSTAAVLSDVNHFGGDNSYTYQWEVSTNDSIFTPVGGSTTANYSPGVLNTVTHYYRRIVSSAICNPNTSAKIVVTVHQNISNNTINSAQTICFGDIPLSLNGTNPVGGNGLYAYEWLSSSDNSSFTPVWGSSDYTPPSLTSTVYYRRIVTSGPCLPITSSSIGILVLPAIFDNSVSANQTICTGTQPNILLGVDASGGNANYSYNWQSSSDNISFNSAPGSNNQRDYTSPVLTSNTYFRRSVTSGPCASLSDTLAIALVPIIGDNTIGSNQTICFGNSPSTLTGMIPSGGGGNYSYQWQSSLNNNTWSNIPLANSGSYPGVNLQSTHYYRRIVSASYCSANTSSSVRINVYNVFVPGMITTTDSVICYNESPTQFVLSSNPSGGDGTYTYNWQSSSNGSAPWNNVGTGNTFQSGNIQTNTYYRLQVTSGSNCGTQATNQIHVTVNPLPAPFQIIGNDTVCRNQQVTIFKLSNDSTYFSRLWSIRNSLGAITHGFNQAVSYVNWGMVSGWDTIVFIRTNNNTTCSRTVNLPVYVSNGVAPALTSILRKPNSNILACNDSTPGIQYQWGYCLKADVSNFANYTDISGANLQYVFLPSAPGFDTFNYYYYVKTFYNDPQCQTISYYNYDPIVLGTDNLKEDGFSLYPNPSAGEVFLKHNNSDVKQVQAFSLTGAEIAIEYDALAQKIKFNEAIPTGLYLLVIQLDEGFITGRVQIIR